MTFLQWVKIYKGTSTHFVSHVYLDALLFDGEKIRSCNLHDVSRLATQLKIGTNVRTWTRGKRKGKKRRISRFGKINAIYVELWCDRVCLGLPCLLWRGHYVYRQGLALGEKPKLWPTWTCTSAQSNSKTLPRPEVKKNPGCFFLEAEKWQARRPEEGIRQDEAEEGEEGEASDPEAMDDTEKRTNQAPSFPSLSPFDFFYRIESRSVKNGEKIIIFSIF